jgi:hypothetical protein
VTPERGPRLGRHQRARMAREAPKRRGWRAHGILVVSDEDPRLSWPERELVRQLGTKLYGARPEGGR